MVFERVRACPELLRREAPCHLAFVWFQLWHHASPYNWQRTEAFDLLPGLYDLCNYTSSYYLAELFGQNSLVC